MDIQIRQAAIRDMEPCATILSTWIEETHWMPRIHTLKDMIQHYKENVFKDRRVVVAQVAQKIVAFMAISTDQFITALYIERSFRGMGLGAKLIERAKADMPSGIRLWTFQHNMAAQKFYKQHGFVEIARTGGDNEEKLPDILFEWLPDLKGAA